MNTQHPLVSIIIPTFNRAHLIGETLDSVLAQTYKNWECIIVDDGSTDNTDEVVGDYVKKDPRFKYFHRPDSHKPGGNGARNYGFEVSSGEYVNWFDDDDVMLEEFLKAKIDEFTKEIVLVICSGYYWDEESNHKENFDLSIGYTLYQDYILHKLKMVTNNVLFKRSFLEEQSLFLETMLRGQEAEYFSRLFFQLPKHSYKILNKPLFLYRNHLDTKTVKSKRYVKAYKESRFIYLYDNFKRCQIIDDRESLSFLYKLLISLFYYSLKNNHRELSNKIIDNFFQLLKKENLWKAYELIFVGRILTFYKYPRLKFYNRWKFLLYTK